MLARVDDLDGSVKDVVAVTFGFKGKVYAIDLGPDSRAALEAALAPFLGSATEYAALPQPPEQAEVKISTPAIVVPSPKRTPPKKPVLTSVKGPSRSAKKLTAESPKLDFRAVRDWAPANGYSVSATGRVPKIVVQAYRDAHA
jgi:hypothetical protein